MTGILPPEVATDIVPLNLKTVVEVIGKAIKVAADIITVVEAGVKGVGWLMEHADIEIDLGSTGCIQCRNTLP